MYIANGQLDERSRPIDNKYAFMNKHASNNHVLYAKKPACKSINISAIDMTFTQSHIII